MKQTYLILGLFLLAIALAFVVTQRPAPRPTTVATPDSWDIANGYYRPAEPQFVERLRKHRAAYLAAHH